MNIELRDFFAGCALTGILSNSPHFFSEAAETAFRFADEMMQHVETKEEPSLNISDQVKNCIKERCIRGLNNEL